MLLLCSLCLQLAFVALEALDDVIDVATEGSGDVAAAVADAVVGDAVLREVVGADLLAAVASAHQSAALGGELSVFFIDLALEEAGA